MVANRDIEINGAHSRPRMGQSVQTLAVSKIPNGVAPLLSRARGASYDVRVDTIISLLQILAFDERTSKT